jgi:hypothetical protein
VIKKLVLAFAVFMPSCILLGMGCSDDASSPRPTTDAATEASDDAPVTTPPTDAESSLLDDAPAPPGCGVREITVIVAAADVNPGTSECAGAIARGTDTFMNIGVGVAMLRFPLDEATATAVRAGKAAAVRLGMTYDPGPGVANEPGALTAHVMRNDWVEGPTPYGGADMCRRTSGSGALGWGLADAPPSGATRIAQGVDYGGAIGTTPFGPSTVDLDLAIVRDALLVEWPKFSKTNELSLYLEESESGKIIIAARENSTLRRPSLVIDLCK